MRRGLLTGLVVGVLVLGFVGAVVFYLLAVPGMLASGYKERAEPEHERVEKALDPVYDTFSRKTFGEDTSELDEIDETALTEAPDWPLLGGRGDLKETESIADEESDYLGKARRFLAGYKRLVNWAADRLRFYRRVGITIGRGGEAVPDNPSSPRQITRPIEASARELDSQVRRFRRRKPPRDVGAEHRNIAASVDFISDQLSGLAKAIARLDIAAAERFDGRIARGVRPYDRRSRGNFRKLIARSVYVRQINNLERRERDIGRAYEKL